MDHMLTKYFSQLEKSNAEEKLQHSMNPNSLPHGIKIKDKKQTRSIILL